MNDKSVIEEQTTNVHLRKEKDMLQKAIDRLWKRYKPTNEVYVMLEHRVVLALRQAHVLPDVIDHVRVFQLRPTGELVYENNVLGCVSAHLLAVTVNG